MKRLLTGGKGHHLTVALRRRAWIETRARKVRTTGAAGRPPQEGVD